MVVDDGVWIVCNEIYFQLLQFVKWHHLFACHSLFWFLFLPLIGLLFWDQFLVFTWGFLKKALLLKRAINDSHMKLICPFSWRLINLHSIVCY